MVLFPYSRMYWMVSLKSAASSGIDVAVGEGRSKGSIVVGGGGAFPEQPGGAQVLRDKGRTDDRPVRRGQKRPIGPMWIHQLTDPIDGDWICSAADQDRQSNEDDRRPHVGRHAMGGRRTGRLGGADRTRERDGGRAAHRPPRGRRCETNEFRC